MKPKISIKELEILQKLRFVSEETKGLLLRTKTVIPVVTSVTDSFKPEEVKTVIFVDAAPVRGNMLITVVVNCNNIAETYMDRLVIPYMGVVNENH